MPLGRRVLFSLLTLALFVALVEAALALAGPEASPSLPNSGLALTLVVVAVGFAVAAWAAWWAVGVVQKKGPAAKPAPGTSVKEASGR